MRIKSSIFGFGAGLILLSFIMFMAYRYDMRQTEVPVENEPMTDEAVIERAFLLGMIWPEDDVEIIRRAFELGMSFISANELSSADELASADELTEPSAIPTEPPTPTPESTPTPTPGPTSTPQPTPTPEPTPTNTPTPVQFSEIINDDGQVYVQVTIQQGSYASTIVKLLRQAGVISDENAFASYLADNNKTRLIKSGTFMLPKDAPFDEILAAITSPDPNEDE